MRRDFEPGKVPVGIGALVLVGRSAINFERGA